MKLLLNFFKELPPRMYGIAALCSIGFALVELWSLNGDNRVKGPRDVIIFFSCAFFMVFVPLVTVWTLVEKCRKKEKPTTENTPDENR
jgi:hypothetical protein